MTNYRIKSLEGWHIGRFAHVKLTFGEVTEIVGRNGSGKSTLMKALMWTLTGATTDGEKLITSGGDEMPVCEVQLESGDVKLTLRKTLIRDTNGSLKGACYVSGLPVKAKEYGEIVSGAMPNDIFCTTTDVFGFFKQTPSAQRAMLLEMAGLQMTEADDPEHLPGLDDLEMRLPALKAKRKELRESLQALPTKIEALSYGANVSEVKADEWRKCKEELEVHESNLKELNEEIASQGDSIEKLEQLRQRKEVISEQYRRWRSMHERIVYEMKALAISLDKVLSEYDAVATECPTCGQEMPEKKVEEIKRKLGAEADLLRRKQVTAERQLEKAQEQLKAIEAEVEGIDASMEELGDLPLINELYKAKDREQAKVNELRMKMREMGAQADRERRRTREIEKLKAKNRELGQKVTETEREIALTAAAIRKRMSQVTNAIKRNFDQVTFKMFDTFKNGEVRNVCEAQMNGVSYGNLSKGEKLKAATEIVRAFSRKYEVSLPLIIDDAESYTENTLSKGERQQILFKVAESDLAAKGATLEYEWK